MSSNDNYSVPPSPAAPLPDAHGQAAFLLVESLIYALIERSVITVKDGVEIIQTAVSVQGDMARAADGAATSMWHAHSLLCQVLGSLEIDLGKPQ